MADYLLTFGLLAVTSSILWLVCRLVRRPRVHPGSIILMHVMTDSHSASRDALRHILDELGSRGYRFVTVNQLLEMARVATYNTTQVRLEEAQE
jgi:peptidoglycan/xylan/chitin deacetylase (PgdA/CDA1 family)